ncbi:transposase [Gordonia sp. HNM0687]|uniref:Transposase n=1 Tax=Gordonia mangrovi TaxID=2665643 RepID=A0A6L7GPM0_9ACTN|nr:DUF5994 family protein [Gordonia mangrovi]MXP21820.1 transposase [Gordonia mangrovi]UVF76193.1 DUF5994 family protein [Gordonia mangrovi]
MIEKAPDRKGGQVPALGPTRLRLGYDLRSPIGGAWLPYTTQISDELAGLQAAGYDRLGKISSISVNWRSLAHYPGLDSDNAPDELPLMFITAERASVTLLVIPARTSSALAAALLRQAGTRKGETFPEHSSVYRTARRILERAAAQHRDATATPR